MHNDELISPPISFTKILVDIFHNAVKVFFLDLVRHMGIVHKWRPIAMKWNYVSWSDMNSWPYPCSLAMNTLGSNDIKFVGHKGEARGGGGFGVKTSTSIENYFNLRWKYEKISSYILCCSGYITRTHFNL